MPRTPSLAWFIQLSLLGGLSWVLNGCAYFPRATPRPIPTVSSMLREGGPASTLVVFLPGRGDRMEDFERRGLSAEMARAGIHADWVSVDAHLGYYQERSVIDRLREDVIGPARVRGYRRIVVVGISLGGLGALLYSRDRPGEIDGLVLMAPFLGGKDKVFAEITAAGGPEAWASARQNESREMKNSDLERELWSFLGKRHAQLPPTWLAFGEADRYAEGHRLFAPLIPDNRVFRDSGGHDWKTWQVLWREVCERSDAFAEEKKVDVR